MHHLDQSVEDLLKNESFCNFLREANEQDIQLWQSYLAQHPEKRELIEEATRQYRRLFNTIADLDLQEQLQQLRNKVELNESTPVYSIRERSLQIIPLYRRKWMLAALSLLLVIAGWFLLRPRHAGQTARNESRYISKPGEKMIFQLPDGTQVTMNAGSEITLNDFYGRDTREVYLKGEAFFDVHANKHSPFIVHTADMDIKALGTAFNVRSYSGDKMAETALIRGLVEITLKKEHDKKLLLHPNEKIAFRQETAALSPALPAQTQSPAPVTAVGSPAPPKGAIIVPVKKMEDGTPQELAWASSNLVFDDESFDEIAIRLERWYGVKIIFKSADIEQYHFTGSFKKEKIERVLDILKTSREFDYQPGNDQTIIIYK